MHLSRRRQIGGDHPPGLVRRRALREEGDDVARLARNGGRTESPALAVGAGSAEWTGWRLQPQRARRGGAGGK